MAKVQASLKDVQTKFVNAPPDRYVLKVKKVEEEKTKADPPNQDKERQNFSVEVTIVRSVDGNEEQKGKPVFHNISMHTKKGEPNGAGQADIKRFYIACLGIDEEDQTYDWDALDTDMLVNQDFECDVYIEPWEKNGRKGASNRLQTTSMTAVGAGR